MVNSMELIGTKENATLYTRCSISRCPYNRVPLYYMMYQKSNLRTT